MSTEPEFTDQAERHCPQCGRPIPQKKKGRRHKYKDLTAGIQSERLWTIKDVSYYLGVPIGTLHYWHHLGQGRPAPVSADICATESKTSAPGSNGGPARKAVTSDGQHQQVAERPVACAIPRRHVSSDRAEPGCTRSATSTLHC